ncbi:MAG: glycosyl hydrolase family 32 [Bacteroidales bacterium]|nr:glycosyl hydrolase family 32 [Bacteroidales bacterium]
MKKYMNLLMSLLVSLLIWGCEEKINVVGKHEPLVATDGGYLFAHMTDDNYGTLFYSVSRDAYHWETLNDGRTVLPAYYGHPDICKGKDGYYMISVKKGTGIPLLWHSTDLVEWTSTKLAKSIFNKISELHGYRNEETYYGAPKMFYDEESGKYIITWHAGKTGDDSDAKEWDSKRTFYILTEDFRTFTDPQFLFSFTGTDEDMATIDVIIRRMGDTYYAIMKDERTQEAAPETGKTIRIAKSEGGLTGPYANPGERITPLDRWHEAPIVVPTVDDKGFFLFTENYPKQYDMYEAVSLDGPWTERYFEGPKARHGCMVRINETEYQAILKAYRK